MRPRQRPAVDKPPLDEEDDLSLAARKPFRWSVGGLLLFGYGNGRRGIIPFLRKGVLYGLIGGHRPSLGPGCVNKDALARSAL